MSTSSARAHQINASNSGSGPSRNGAFRVSLLSQIFYGMGDWIYSLAIVILAYRLSGGIAAAAAVLLFQVAGRLAGMSLAPSVGALDPRRMYRLAIGAGIVRAALIGSLAFVRSDDQLWLAMAVAAAVGLLSPLSEGARRALAPIASPAGRSRSLWSRFICRWDQLVMIAGSIAGGLVIVLWNEQAALAIAAAMGVIAVLLLQKIPAPSNPLPAHGKSAARPPNLPPFRELSTLHVLMLALAGGAALGIAIRILLIEIVIEDHGSSELMYGLFVALAGVGAFAGPLSVPRLLGKLPSEFVLAGITAALTVALIATHVADPLPLIVPIVIGCGILAITGERAGETIIRRVVPDHELDGALRLLTIVTIVGQAFALALVASLHFLSGVTLVLLSLTSVSVFCASLPILMYVGKRTQSTASGGD